MEIGQFVAALRADLERMADIADEETQRAADRLSAALESSVRLRVMDLLGAVAADLDEQLHDARVEVRLAGSEPELVVIDDQPERADDEPGDGDQSARLTLRLPPRLKGRIDEAAAAAGVSTNTWVVRALMRAATAASTRHVAGARRLRGSGRS
jgi:predicted HicB family RNase H-like nuclease